MAKQVVQRFHSWAHFACWNYHQINWCISRKSHMLFFTQLLHLLHLAAEIWCPTDKNNQSRLPSQWMGYLWAILKSVHLSVIFFSFWDVIKSTLLVIMTMAESLINWVKVLPSINHFQKHVRLCPIQFNSLISFFLFQPSTYRSNNNYW